MIEKPPTADLTPTIRAALARLRRQIRRYVWLEGLAVATVWLGGVFWIVLAVDWFFEPPRLARALFLAVAAGGAAVLLNWLIVRRLLVRLRDRNMAMLLERRFPQFGESLLTAVELTQRGPARSQCNPLLLERTCQTAEETLPAVHVGAVFDLRPLGRSLAGAVLVVLSVVIFGLGHPAAMNVWARRNLLMSEELWPRQARLLVDGFANGVVKVARGTDLDIIAKADLAKPLVPQTLEVRYRTVDGARGRATMTREGTADRSRDEFQEFSHTFRGVLTPLLFDVVGGDAAVRGLRVDVVESPAIVGMALECQYPPYMARPPRTVPVSGPMLIPAGTQVAVHARTNKDLVRVMVESALDDPPKPPQKAELGRQSDARGFCWEIARLDSDQTLLFTLVDTDGIRSREPVRLSLACVADEAPKLALRLSGIGPAITPSAHLPATGQVTDDYGVARTWFEYTVDQEEPARRGISELEGNPTSLTMNEAFEAADLNLKAGQKLLLAVQAADRCDRAGPSNVGTSERWHLDVVTPEQLRAMLESRELVLRQRFETILNEVTETRDSLVRMDFGAGRGASGDGASHPAGDGSEPGDRPAPSGSEQTLGLEGLRIERALQNSRKDAHEVLGVAEAIDDIREELINNRLDTVELRMRLEQGISQPLRQIAGEMFPELERRLERLADGLSDSKLGPTGRDAARQQCDAILLAMRQVLGRMLELEDFNEAVELLHSIIASQEKLSEQTRQRQKQTLRDLLEE